MALNDLIAASGQKLYENMRKGFIERPEEARQRGLEEMRLQGMGQEQELRGLQIESERAGLEEQAAGAPIRKLRRAEETRKLQSEYLAAQEKAAAETAGLERDKLRTELARKRQEIAQAATKEEREIETANAKEYGNIVLGAVSQPTTEDAVAYIAANKQSLLDAGGPEEDATIEAILAAPPEEQAQLISILRNSQPDIIEHVQELEKEAAKAAGKPKGKATMARKANASEVGFAEDLIKDHPTLGDLPGRDAGPRKKLAEATANRAQKHMSEARDAGRTLDLTTATNMAIGELVSNKDKWLSETAAGLFGTSEIRPELLFEGEVGEEPDKEQPEEIVRNVNGRKAIFDANKKFLRWAE